MIFRGSRKMRLVVLMYFAVSRWMLWWEVVRIRLGRPDAGRSSVEDGTLAALRV